MEVGRANGIGKDNEAVSERSMSIENLGNTHFEIVIEVMHFTFQEQKQTHSTSKVAFELLKA